MRSSFNRASLHGVALTLAAILAPALVHGQGVTQFQGVVTFQTEGGRTFNYAIRKGKVRIDMNDANRKGAMILDPAANKMYMLLPEQRMYMEMQVPKGNDLEAKEVKPTRTGKSEMIAGHKCDYWNVKEEQGEVDICLASDMGGFQAFSNKMIGNASAWQKAIGKNAFPLKVIAHKAGEETIALVATKVEKKALDASMFAPPASYKKMEMNVKSPGTPR